MKSSMIFTIIAVNVLASSAASHSGHTREAIAAVPDPHSLKQMRGAKLVPQVPYQEMVPIDEHKEAVEDKRTDGHHLYALTLLCTMTTIVGAFALVSCSNPIIVKNTWLVLDSVAVVIMAVSIFYVAEHFCEDLGAGAPHYITLLHILFALGLFFASVFGAWALRNNPVNIASFNAVMYWVVLLAKGGALSATQENMGASLLDVMLITLGALFFFAALMVVSHHIKPEKGWYDDVETGLAGGAFAGGFVTMVGMLINGEHSHDHASSGWQDTEVLMMRNTFALATCIAAVCLTPVIGRHIADNKDNYWYRRSWVFVNEFIGILPYFTVSVGSGGLVCNYFEISPERKMAHVVGAFMGGITGFLMVVACAFTPRLQKDDPESKNLAGLILGFGGYIAGYGWAMLIVGAMEELPEDRGYSPHKTQMLVMGIIVLINAILMPVYVIFLKPEVTKKTT